MSRSTSAGHREQVTGFWEWILPLDPVTAIVQLALRDAVAALESRNGYFALSAMVARQHIRAVVEVP